MQCKRHRKLFLYSAYDTFSWKLSFAALSLLHICEWMMSFFRLHWNYIWRYEWDETILEVETNFAFLGRRFLRPRLFRERKYLFMRVFKAILRHGYYGNYGNNSYCPYDYVEIFDLDYPSTFIKIKGCGYQSPWCVKSKSPFMSIRFVTNSISSYRGFTAHYRVSTNPPAGGNCLPLNPNASSWGILLATPSA